MRSITDARVLATSFLAASALAPCWLAIITGCGGDAAVSAAGALPPAETTDVDSSAEAGEQPPDAGSADASEAEVDASASAGDQLAFDTFTVGDQGAVVATGTASTGVRIVLGSSGLFCGGTGLAGQSSIELNVATTATSLTAGTYLITNGTGGTTRTEATFERIDQNCATLTAHAAESGSITITSVDATSVKGMFDVVFSGFDHGRAVGGFTAPLCNAGLWGPHANCLP